MNPTGDVLEYVRAHQGEHLRNIQELLRQPSISYNNTGIKETARLLENSFNKLCFETEVVEDDRYYPIVIGKREVGAKKTLIIYMMYDTMPIDDIGEWSVPPLEARIVDKPHLGKCLLARGAENSKGPLMAFLNALESINAVEGKPPVNLVLLAEGEEELSSPHLMKFMETRGRELRHAEGLLSPNACQDSKGIVSLHLGSKGCIDFDLECNGREWQRGPQEYAIHSSMKAVFDDPAWHLIEAIASLADKDGNDIQIDGFYEKVREPTREDLELVGKLAEKFDPETWKETFKVHQYARGLTSSRDIILKYVFSPSINVCGIEAGYTGPGPKTIISHKASAKINVRLVPDQLPFEIYGKIRKHLDKRGFRDLIIKEGAGNVEPCRFNLHSALAGAIVRTYQDQGLQIQIWPLMAGGWPGFLFGKLGIQCFSGGIGHGGNAHAPDEYLVIEGNGRVGGLFELERSFVQILHNFAES